MITPAQRAEIRCLFYGEHWKVGTIAAQLGLHHETVRAAVQRETAGVRPSLCRPSILDPYLPFIRDTLAQYPNLRATRVYEMVRQRGYPGSVIQVRRLVRRLRPETNRAVYRRVVTLPVAGGRLDQHPLAHVLMTAHPHAAHTDGGAGNSRRSRPVSSTDSGRGQLSPATLARRRYSPTVDGDVPRLRAMALMLNAAVKYSRSTSRILRMDNLLFASVRPS